MHVCDCNAYNMIYNINNRPSVWPNNSLTIVFFICVCIFPFNFHFQFSLMTIVLCSFALFVIFTEIHHHYYYLQSMLDCWQRFFLLLLLSDSKTKQCNKKKCNVFWSVNILCQIWFFVIIYYFYFDVFIHELKNYSELHRNIALHLFEIFFIKID